MHRQPLRHLITPLPLKKKAQIAQNKAHPDEMSILHRSPGTRFLTLIDKS
jgi:hypothetical protein